MKYKTVSYREIMLVMLSILGGMFGSLFAFTGITFGMILLALLYLAIKMRKEQRDKGEEK